MKSIRHTTRAVVRDPGTVFISWDIEEFTADNGEYLLIVRNISSGGEDISGIDYNTGRYYIHSLAPDTYYAIIIALYEPVSRKMTQLLDFGVVHTFRSSISSISDPDRHWATDRETLLRISGTECEGAGSSYDRHLP